MNERRSSAIHFWLDWPVAKEAASNTIIEAVTVANEMRSTECSETWLS